MVQSRRLVALVMILVFAWTGTWANADEPMFNNRPLSEWDQMLREQQSSRLRKVAIIALGQIATDNAKDIKLVQRIMTSVGKALRNDSSEVVRGQAATLLGQMAFTLIEEKDGDPASVVLDLSENLRVEKNSEVRQYVATALGRFGKFSRIGVPPLVGILNDERAATRAAAADAMGRIGKEAKAGTAELMALIADTDKAVRASAVFALGRISVDDPAKVSAALTPRLTGEPESTIRREVAASLGFIADNSPATIQSMTVGLKDEEVEVRRQVAQSLAQFGAGVKLIERELTQSLKNDEDSIVRNSILRTLSSGYGTDVKVLIPLFCERLKEDKNFDVRVAIADELGAMGAEAKAALPSLREAQKDPQIKVREAAARAIKSITKPPMAKGDGSEGN